MRVLAGDIGATNSRLALVRVEGGNGSRARVEERATYPSTEHHGLAEVVSRFVDRVGRRPDRACFGVAAPVRSGRADFANLDWEIELEGLEGRIGVRDVRVINDFEAVCHGLPMLDADGVVDLLDGEPDPGGAVAVLGAGTGLGHAFLTREGNGGQVHSSEAGHADFGPRTPTQDDLLGWLRDRHGRASWERVVSGPGLADVHRFLVETGRADRASEPESRMEDEDPPAAIARRGLEGGDPTCRRALEIFAEAFGAQAGNFALAVQATGGVFLGGGIAPRILPVLRGDGFRRAFREKGKMTSMMEEVPVRVITDPDAGLLGAARAALTGGRDV